MKKAYVFPGQGAQFVGMGKDLYENSELAKSLFFPDYFGSSWDALNDCLVDLTWINEKQIIIVFESLSQLGSKTHDDLLNVLNDVVQFWNTNDDLHDIVIIITS